MSRIGADQPEQGSSRTPTVVLLSLLILAVAGALFGYVLGLRDIDENKSASGDVPSAVPSDVTSAGAAPPSKVVDCPPFISAAVKQLRPDAATPLQQVQYVRTDSNKEAWICRERDGSGLWYQGHDRKENWFDGGEIPEEGKNGLLRPDVQDRGNRTYAVTNQDVTYVVTPRGLSIGSRTYGAIQAYPAP
ncbi:hypothetical protein ACQP00_46340 [Dactylosporangium sp. CS-047395]|uniref:hypothetical protein n=1 Tax=Dactylosporangium sp. CS-047395 TaxID=3239936 RepID=UPI003D8FAFD9